VLKNLTLVKALHSLMNLLAFGLKNVKLK